MMLLLALFLALLTIHEAASQSTTKGCTAHEANLLSGPANLVTSKQWRVMLQHQTSRDLLHAAEEAQNLSSGLARIAKSDRDLHSSSNVVDEYSSEGNSKAAGIQTPLKKIVTPPPEPMESPLQSVDGALTEEVDDSGGNKSSDAYPVMLLQILLLWKFVVFLCVTSAAILVVNVIYHLWSESGVLHQQAAKFQFMILLALLIVCPACRADINSRYGTAFWVVALRNLLEMWLMLLAYCTLPYMMLNYISGCCKEGDRKLEAVSEDPKFKLSPGVRQQVTARSQCTWLTSKGWQGVNEMEVVRQTGKQITALLAVRALIPTGRSLLRLASIAVEPSEWQAAAFPAISLVLLLAAVALGSQKLSSVVGSLAKALGVQPILRPVQTILAITLVAAQFQDLVFVLYFGSEKLAQVFSSVLFMMEIVGALLAVGALLISDPLQEMVKHRAPETESSAVQRLKLLLKPLLFLETEILDPAVSLQVRPLAGAVTPVYTQEQPELVKRNVWRGVLTDIFADKVRSKMLAAVIIAVVMTEAVWTYPKFVAEAHQISVEYFPEHAQMALGGLQFFSGLFFVFCSWVAIGIMLLGNNIYLSKWWLLLTMAALACFACSDSYNFFTLKGQAVTTSLLANGWSRLFGAVLEITAFFECLRILCSNEDVADFYRSQRASQQYTGIMLEKVSCGKEQASHAKKMRRDTSDTVPSLLLVAAVATIPVVLAFALVTLHSGLEVIRYARIGQVYHDTFVESPTREFSLQQFLVLDRNINKYISPDEAGLSLVLGLLGPLGQQLIAPMKVLWAHAHKGVEVTALLAVRNMGWNDIAEKDPPTQDERLLIAGESSLAAGASQSLDLDQFYSFLDIMHRIYAISRSLTSGDLSVAAQFAVEALDTNKDGDLDKRELRIPELALALQAAAPQLSHLVAPTLNKAWKKADGDGDGKLSIEEFPDILIGIRNTIMQLEKAVQDLVLPLVLSGMSNSTTQSESAIDTMLAIVANPSLILQHGAAEQPQYKIPAEVIDNIVNVLKRSTASVSEALSLLLVAFNTIVPEHIATAEKLIADTIGKDLSAQLAQVAEERWQNENTGSEASADNWRQEDIEKMRNCLNKFMEKARPWLQEEGTRAKVFLTAIAQGAGVPSDVDDVVDILNSTFDAGVPSDVDAVTILNSTFNALDTKPKDGKLDFKELGLHGALALVNPALASYAQGFFDAACKFALGTAGVDKETLSYFLQLFTQIFTQYASDSNGDGEVDARDARFIARSTLQKLTSLGESSVSLIQTWKPMKLRKLVRPGIDLPQVSGSTAPQTAIGMFSLSQAGQIGEVLQKVVQFLVNFNINRIETGLYAAALLSFWFGVIVVAMPFIGYSEIYEKLQRGDTTFQGGSAIDELKGRLDWAAAFPGMLFSTVFLGVLIVFFFLFSVFTFLAIPDLYIPYIWQLKVPIAWLVLTLSIMFGLKKGVLDNICVVDGEPVYPRLFSCIYVMLIIINFAVGMLGAISRLACMLPFMFFKFHVLSTSLLEGDDVVWDGGYAPFLAAVKHDHDVSNPIRRSFLQAIAPQGNSLFGKEPLEEPRPQSKLQRARNRFWTCYMISKAPELKLLRKSALASRSEEEKGCLG